MQEKIDKYRIRQSNIYNFDEKGFLLGLCHTLKRIVALDRLQRKKILGASQDGSREFISLLACICADGTALPPGLIYQGDSGDLQDSWLEDFDHSSDEAYFAVSRKGWTNEDLGISWLQKIFDHHTKQKAGRSHRLLLVDGHSSHVNLRFVNYCDQHRILLVILPPHSTHRLQPLDVGIFSPLAHAYSKEIDQLIQSSCGFTRVTKRSFWILFKSSWTQALTLENIRSSFATPGIFPVNSSKTLNSLKYQTPSPTCSDNESKRETPASVRGLRRITKHISKEEDSISADMALIIRGSQKIAIRAEILEHENKGLRKALIEEKRRRKKGKKMGLFDNDEPGQAQFFSPTKIATVRERAQEIEEQNQREKALAEENKRQRALAREQKAAEAQNRREERVRMQAEKKERMEREKAQRQAQILAKKQERESKKALEMQNKAKKKNLKPVNKDEEMGNAKHQNVEVSRSGRQIRPPTRFDD